MSREYVLKNTKYVLKNTIESMRQRYDYILIDCMPSLGMMTINALVAADSVIIPSQPNFLSTKGLNLLLRSISKIKRQINSKLKIDGILLTMVESNFQRSQILPSEKAFAYKMRLEAMKRQGQRTDLTSTPVVEKLSGKDALSVTAIGNEVGESREQIRRYIRLTYLVPELLQYVDEGQIKMRPAVELSYLDEDCQRTASSRRR